jgi:hypothetical protein
MAEEEGARTLREGASFPSFVTFHGVLKSYEVRHSPLEDTAKMQERDIPLHWGRTIRREMYS